jgi:hypothetical protein
MAPDQFDNLEKRVAHIEQCIRELCLVLSDRDPKLWEYMQKLINTLPADDNADNAQKDAQ